MAVPVFQVKEFSEHDDFDYYDRLAWEEHIKRGERIGVRKDSEFSTNRMRLIRKENYFPDANLTAMMRSKGFVLEADGELTSMASITLSPSGNGTITQIGYANQNRRELGPIVEACLAYVRQNGGDKLFCMTEILPGQIYNAEFEYWSRYAFQPEPYYSQWLICHDLHRWQIPDDLDAHDVVPAGPLNLDEIEAILREDGEDFIAESIRYDYAELTPDHVFLKLCDPADGRINGIAYYHVNRSQGALGTNTLGIHIRPRLGAYEEIQRFVRCVLASMKQLDLAYAGTRMSSRNLLSMIALCAEGFALAPMGQVIFYRPV